MSYTINRVVVIGSGTMGGGIAAHVANAGVQVYLLDIAPRELTPEEEKRGLSPDSPEVRNRIVNASLERLKKSRPAAFFTPEVAELVTVGNLEDNFEWVGRADWIVEAIVEELEPKRQLFARIEKVRKARSIISSNTSGLPIAALAAECSEDFKAHLLGTHFFNPPRYMKLLEVIPTRETLPEITAFMTEFAERRLGKGVVICKDTPNFIANRFGSISAALALSFALDNNYTIEETDAILGPLIGRPKTAMFRLQDLVGLDVASGVAENLYGLIEHDETREVLRNQNLGTLRTAQMERGRLGDKTGQGFYRKPPKGTKGDILTLDLETMEYRERREPDIPSVREAMKIKPLDERLGFVLRQDDKAGALARHTVYNSLAYAARRVPEITDHIINVDRAVRWGFSHELGPFELWDALGVRKIVGAMEDGGIHVAPWVKEMLDTRGETFYRMDEGRLSFYDPASRSYISEPSDERKVELRALKAAGRVVRENRGASLIDLGDGVACLEFHTKMNTLDEQIKVMLREAVEELETGDWRGLVIGNEGADFSVGANLAVGSGAGDFDAIERAVREMQDALQSVRFSSKPVVTAPFGRCLGGGCEVSMAGARAVASAETYMGLVEVGVGLIPGAGGCKELVRRIVSPPMRVASADPLPFLQQALQTIATAKVSTSAAEARGLGYLAEADLVVMNRDHQLAEAKRLVLELDEAGYVPPARSKKSVYAAGRDALAALRAGLYIMQQGGYMSEYDLHVSLKVAHVLTGGPLSSGQWVDEQYFLDLEREAFVSLCGETKTRERITHMLTTGKPLRN
ncbi:MAG TPA: 3-hydroxyacyl-CoA dehydrogenase/enoyl-CoA hydratase family protein [Pyrinomonadaceae bacterium]|jgi:3-hydroxyacyl-CoA dehydrogenase|nr:3-hydroxyacyl-CoA dehydrogenase/enoyl-CoA hydratase family protein [Pyrinomonadaceae bacterium]